MEVRITEVGELETEEVDEEADPQKIKEISKI
jgi:hypothetical protein